MINKHGIAAAAFVGNLAMLTLHSVDLMGGNREATTWVLIHGGLAMLLAYTWRESTP